MSGHPDSSPGARPSASGPIDTSAIAAALKRASSLNTGFPTRTIRITASEQSSRDNTPNPITLEDLVHRPRSNPRNRTPMRYESPLESDAFRIISSSVVHEESRRITIRPSAGAAVGTAPRRPDIHVTEVKRKSTKQGPSQRKLRRWRNEHFVGLAAELSSSRGAAAAEVLLQAHRDAHLYRSIYDPNEHSRSEPINRFMTDDGMKEVRDHFFEGHGPEPTALPHQDRSVRPRKRPLTGDEMLLRIDPRLRRLVVRACHNSYAAAKVVQRLEAFVVASFTSGGHKRRENDDLWWESLLLECPTVTRRKDSERCTAQFFFGATLPTAGFHRLLLHAVCQFHGLNVASRMESNFVVHNQEVTSARALVATGHIDDASSGILLLQHLGEVVDDPICAESPTAIVDQMAALRV